jgi:hypothetical protein
MPSPTVAVTAGTSLIGSSMAGSAARSAAKTSANAQIRAAEIAAEEQRFRPVGVSTRFGSSQFQFGPEGRLTGAGYEASPEIQALQDRLSALYGDSLGMAERAAPVAGGLFDLAGQYMATTPEQARQQYINEQTALLDPIRREEEQRLASSVFGRGRAGLNVGATGQPELAALAAARRTQDLQLAAGAEAAAQQRIGFGTGLFDTASQLQTRALSPFQAQFGTAQLLEEAALQPLDIGAQLGGRSAQAGQASGQSLLQGGLTASQTRLQGSMVGPSLMANNISNIGNQYLQQQQQQQLFNQMMMARSPSIYGASNVYGPYGSGTVPTLSPNVGEIYDI